MRSYGKQLLLILGVGFLVGCQESFGPTDTPTSLEPAAKQAPAAVYDYVFTGDIEGTLQNVSASPSDPFKQVGSNELSFNFPAFSSGDTGICYMKNPELLPSTNEWRGYASAPWAGALDLSRRKRSSFHLQITGTQADGAGSINLAVNDVAEEGTVGGDPQIRFRNARALVSAFSYSETFGEAPAYDAQDRCVNFEITATRQL